jgi:hypothetical protein
MSGMWLPKSAIDPVKKYRTTSRTVIDPVDFLDSSGFTTVQILPELIGCKVDIMAVSLCWALGARAVRITQGECTTDSDLDRATILVDADDRIISVEVGVCFCASAKYGPMCGADLDQHLGRLKLGDEPKEQCGNVEV